MKNIFSKLFHSTISRSGLICLLQRTLRFLQKCINNTYSENNFLIFSDKKQLHCSELRRFLLEHILCTTSSAVEPPANDSTVDELYGNLLSEFNKLFLFFEIVIASILSNSWSFRTSFLQLNYLNILVDFSARSAERKFISFSNSYVTDVFLKSNSYSPFVLSTFLV